MSTKLYTGEFFVSAFGLAHVYRLLGRPTRRLPACLFARWDPGPSDASLPLLRRGVDASAPDPLRLRSVVGSIPVRRLSGRTGLEAQCCGGIVPGVYSEGVWTVEI